MKRIRNFVKRCDCCNIQFESHASFTRHCNTKNHKHKQLGFQNAMVMARDEDREDRMIRSSAAADPPYLLHEGYPLDVEPEEEMTDSMGSELSDDSDQEGQTAQTEERAQTRNNFYPFPDEKFFLLYCYAHGIMRPKV